MSIVENVISVRLDDKNDALVILDQTLLPNEVTYLRLKTAEEIWQAIKRLQVRGPPPSALPPPLDSTCAPSTSRPTATRISGWNSSGSRSIWPPPGLRRSTFFTP